MRIVYSDHYHFDLGAHVYPTVKYRLLHARLTERGVLQPGDLVEPETAAWEDLALVHTEEHLRKMRAGDLSAAEVALLEIPWSPEIVESFRLMTGGTITAARHACAPRGAKGDFTVVAHLGGGFHHAFGNHGEGFCMFNDVAVAIRLLQRDGAIARAAIVDCDVHHGNGTAFIFSNDPAVFTFSMHQQHNYPMFKPRSSLDIGLPDGAGDRTYLDALSGALPRVFAFEPDIVLYLAGADPYRDDQLGGLALSLEGLRARDRLVLRAARAARAPVAITLAGGYARQVDDTIRIHEATIEEAIACAA